ncbi:M20 family metallo-hydrolase [Chelativorans sp. J32]|uniref:M20 family metallo-hydrolase n=1 Tax=Chelativorans sp. J32 TaxID=935840 RepID=UPI0004887651|nr:M20 family metallo-hydrolase [Chelativorans sp. J32]
MERTLTKGDRLWSTLMEMACIGAIAEDGCCRLSLTDEDRRARDLFARWCRDAGCVLRVDPFGNMFAIRPGLRNDAPAILVGSHLDTQPHGGRFDGVLGVLAGLEILRALNDAGIKTEHPIAVVNWTNEEGVRFKPGLTGSKGFIGALDKAAIEGAGGADYFSELSRIGYAGQRLLDFEALAYYELHIEQGPVLELAKAPVGIVEGVQGVRWFEIEFHGQDAHAGTTPMDGRSDSFMAAASLALRLREGAISLEKNIRFTVGRVEVSPNSQNTVPGSTRLHIDVRHGSSPVLDAFERLMVEVISEVEAQENVRVGIRQTMGVAPVDFDHTCRERLWKCARALGLEPVSLQSGAMHDASSLATSLPTAMLFVQSRDGISHNPLEWSDPDHIATACEILAQAVLLHAGAPL